jgi:hypothetical protein
VMAAMVKFSCWAKNSLAFSAFWACKLFQFGDSLKRNYVPERIHAKYTGLTALIVEITFHRNATLLYGFIQEPHLHGDVEDRESQWTNLLDSTNSKRTENENWATNPWDLVSSEPRSFQEGPLHERTSKVSLDVSAFIPRMTEAGSVIKHTPQFGRSAHTICFQISHAYWIT